MRSYSVTDKENDFHFDFSSIERDRSTVARVRMADPGRDERINKFKKLANKEIPLFKESKNE